MVYQRIATLQWGWGEEGEEGGGRRDGGDRKTNDIQKRRGPMYSTGTITSYKISSVIDSFQFRNTLS